MSEIWSKIYISFHVKYSLFLFDFNENFLFWTNSRKIFKYQRGWKYVQWEQSCCMGTGKHTERRTDGRRDRHEVVNSRFSQFCERSKKQFLIECLNFSDTHHADTPVTSTEVYSWNCRHRTPRRGKLYLQRTGWISGRHMLYDTSPKLI